MDERVFCVIPILYESSESSCGGIWGWNAFRTY